MDKPRVTILTMLSVVLMLFLVALPTAAQSPPPLKLTSGGGAPGGGAPSAPLGTVLWNQPNSGTAGIASQYLPDFSTGFYSADDFQNTEPWALDRIFIEGDWGGGGSLPNAVSLNWYIYADAGGVPAGHPQDGGGTEFWSWSCAPTAPEVTLSGANNEDVTLDIIAAQVSTVNLPPGHWWLVFFPSLNLTQYGQWYWDRAGSMNLVDAQFIDPGNLFAQEWTTWTSWYNVIDAGNTYDLAFRLEGNDPTAITVRDVTARALSSPLAALAVLAGVVAVGGGVLLRRRRP